MRTTLWKCIALIAQRLKLRLVTLSLYLDSKLYYRI